MQEAQRAGTFFLFCRGEMGGQGSPKRCVWGGGGRLDDLLPTRTDVTGREETGSKVRRPPHCAGPTHSLKRNAGLWATSASDTASFPTFIRSGGVYSRNFCSFLQHMISGLLLLYLPAWGQSCAKDTVSTFGRVWHSGSPMRVLLFPGDPWDTLGCPNHGGRGWGGESTRHLVGRGQARCSASSRAWNSPTAELPGPNDPECQGWVSGRADIPTRNFNKA